MNLREQIQIDNRQTFLNPNEFADTYIINGKPMLGVLEKSSDSRHPHYAEGVSLISHVLHVSLSEFGEEPEQGERLVINGKTYYVANVIAEMGMLDISLEANVT